MPKFFLPVIDPSSPRITGEDARHIIHSLRMRVGEPLTLCDTRGTDYFCEIKEIGPDYVLLHCMEQQKNNTEPQADITLYQCLPKGDKFEDILKRCVELGISKVIPVLSERCISRPDAKTFEKKRLRFQKIAKEAAMQSGRGVIPQVDGLTPIKKAFLDAHLYESMLVFYEGNAGPVSSIIRGDEKKLAFLIGPEGGFSMPEIECAKEQGLRPATLGKRILRCETAPIAALTLLLYLTGNMG